MILWFYHADEIKYTFHIDINLNLIAVVIKNLNVLAVKLFSYSKHAMRLRNN